MLGFLVRMLWLVAFGQWLVVILREGKSFMCEEMYGILGVGGRIVLSAEVVL
jgi:hypothetical protein